MREQKKGEEGGGGGGGGGVHETEVSFRSHRAESGADTSFITPVSHF